MKNMNKLSWCDKYKLALNENLSIKEIMMLRDCGQPKATQIRNDAIRYCMENDIEFESRRIPTAVVLQITNLGLEYYYNKMLQEAKIVA